LAAINNQALDARAALMESMSSCRPNILALRSDFIWKT